MPFETKTCRGDAKLFEAIGISSVTRGIIFPPIEVAIEAFMLKMSLFSYLQVTVVTVTDVNSRNWTIGGWVTKFA